MSDEQTDDVVEPGDDLLVAVADGTMPENLTESALVQVAGTVYEFDDADLAELGDEFAYLEDETFDAFEGEAILIAETVEIGPQAGHIDLPSIITAPDAYLGSIVTVSGQVEEVLGEQAFIMVSDQEDIAIDTELLAIVDDAVVAQATIVDDAFVRVTGEVLAFEQDETIEFEDETIDLGAELFDDYDGELLIVVTSISVER